MIVLLLAISIEEHIASWVANQNTAVAALYYSVWFY